VRNQRRIVSLAAFLADVTGHPSFLPFIFDDPISSLDHVFEQATADRLVELGKERQVIVFTHRLSFACMIQDTLKKSKNEPLIIYLEKQPWGTGDPCGIPVFPNNTAKAISNLIDQRFQPAKLTYQTLGYASAEYRTHAKALCSEIRIILERLVEHDLLAEVVLRFRRAIQTDNRLIKLHHISKNDCDFLDLMMTKYSRHEHSQPQEIPSSLPQPAEFEEDLYKLKAWQADFARRVEGKTPKPDVGTDAAPIKKAKFLPPGATPK
jgi:hypothetical protein